MVAGSTPALASVHHVGSGSIVAGVAALERLVVQCIPPDCTELAVDRNHMPGSESGVAVPGTGPEHVEDMATRSVVVAGTGWWMGNIASGRSRHLAAALRLPRDLFRVSQEIRETLHSCCTHVYALSLPSSFPASSWLH